MLLALSVEIKVIDKFALKFSSFDYSMQILPFTFQTALKLTAQ